jgi:hypothetical protein
MSEVIEADSDSHIGSVVGSAFPRETRVVTRRETLEPLADYDDFRATPDQYSPFMRASTISSKEELYPDCDF